MKVRQRVLWIAAIAVMTSGCQVTKPITRRSELLGTGKIEQLVVATKDSVFIRAIRYRLLDSTLALEGMMQRGSRWEPFKDTLRLTDIAYIQTIRNDGFKGVVAVAAAGFILYRAFEPILAAGSGTTIVPQSHYAGPGSGGGGSGSSCPFVYSWDGRQYALDGEAYAMAWGRQLEMTTSTLLKSAAVRQGAVRVRLTNERPETHYTNSVALRVAVVEQGTTAVPDCDGVLWPVRRPEPPLSAVDGGGKDILDALVHKDGRRWESDLHDIGAGSGFVDNVELRFAKTRESNTGTLVLRAINTEIFGVVLQNIGDLLGEEILPFVHALDTDTSLAATLRTWTEDASLKVDVWDGTSWRRAGMVLPEANVAEFAKAVRIDIANPGASEIRVRLSALSGVWKLDAVGVDWASAQPLRTREVPAHSAIDGSGEDVRASLLGNDASRVTVLPGGRIDLTYACPDPGPGKDLICVLDVRGYLHEWLPPARPISPLATLIPTASRVSNVGTLLRARRLLLPPLYAEWKAQRPLPER